MCVGYTILFNELNKSIFIMRASWKKGVTYFKTKYLELETVKIV